MVFAREGFVFGHYLPHRLGCAPADASRFAVEAPDKPSHDGAGLFQGLFSDCRYGDPDPPDRPPPDHFVGFEQETEQRIYHFFRGDIDPFERLFKIGRLEKRADEFPQLKSAGANAIFAPFVWTFLRFAHADLPPLYIWRLYTAEALRTRRKAL